MKNLFKFVLSALIITGLASCDASNKNPDQVTKVTNKEVIENYAKMVHQNYKDSYDAALAMQVKINEFIANPTLETMTAAKKAWLEAREPYGQSEVFRGSNGPIDFEGEADWAINNEGQINAWPLNEAYIDYVKTDTKYTGSGGIYSQSIVGDVSKTITKELLAGMNEGGDGSDEAAVSTGWHAIEFLLWGQDDQRPAPFTDAKNLELNRTSGWRPVEDFTKNVNADRRKQYLKVVTELLIDDLKALVDTWAVGGKYYNVFMALPENEALQNIISGPQFLAMSELSSERMLIPAYGDGGFEGCGQEDEHSCFSDNTHRDVYLNAKGIVNVLKGEYAGVKGASFINLVKNKDLAQGKKLEEATNEMWAAIVKIDEKAKAGTPFDLMILNEGKGAKGEVIIAAEILDKLGAVIKESASKLGLKTATKEELGPTMPDPNNPDDLRE